MKKRKLTETQVTIARLKARRDEIGRGIVSKRHVKTTWRIAPEKAEPKKGEQ